MIEDGYPLVESMLRGLFGIDGVQIKGRMTGELPRTGELNPDIVREALGLPALETAHSPQGELANRPPALCKGCPHTDSFRALNEALSGFDSPQVFSDIGCYTLAALPPLEAVHSCVAMGASIGMAAGAAHAGYAPAVAAIGDSTFSHGGITPLLSAVQQHVNLNVLVVDNSTVGMTGTQRSMSTGQTLDQIILGTGHRGGPLSDHRTDAAQPRSQRRGHARRARLRRAQRHRRPARVHRGPQNTVGVRGRGMEKNIILAGVGGQGILSIAFVIDNAALDAGFHFKQAEVHGMAQRGGAVQSHLRYGDSEIYSDIVPTGRADLILSVEPLEVLRYWHYLQPDGWVVTSVTPYVNIPDYPEMDDLLGELSGFSNIVMVDTANIARAAGNLRSQNMAAVGAASPLVGLFRGTAPAVRRSALQPQGREDRRGQPARLQIRTGGRALFQRAGGRRHVEVRGHQTLGEDRGGNRRPGSRPDLG